MSGWAWLALWPPASLVFGLLLARLIHRSTR